MLKSLAPIFILPPNYSILRVFVLLTVFSNLKFPFSVANKAQFGSSFVLIGDAKFTDDSSFIQLTLPRTSSPSSGLLVQRNPIKFSGSSSKPRKPISFSSDFTFSISPHNGDGLAFLVLPRSCLKNFSRESFGILNESKFLAIEFDTSIDENVGDLNPNHVGIDVNTLKSAKTSNVSSINLVLNSGMKFHSWVDYDSTSKLIEVRLSKFGSFRPYTPLLAYKIDLGEMWRNEEVLVGLSSSNGETMQISNVYSWKFRTRTVPSWLHSQPLDPRQVSEENLEKKSAQKKRICALGFLSGLVFMVGCGALVALIVLSLWALFENNLETILTIPAKCSLKAQDFRYEKVNVVVEDDNIDEAKD